MDNRKPLYNRLIGHNKLDRSSFHTPGHKCSDFLPENLIRLDYTELPDTDALFEAESVILALEKKLSLLYHTERSCLSAGGCTLAIQTMIRAAARCGGEILCARNAHRSAVNAMALLGMDPIWIYPKGANNYTGRIIPDDVQSAFKEHPDITACYITSPSYYGEISDIRRIAEICHNNKAILLVDNAHGSHLAFMQENIHPINLGADMSACSLHKTMPVMTGGAVLNIRTKELSENAKSDMALFGSTSPSYVIMSSVDLCADYMLYGTGKEDYQQCEKTVAKLKKLSEKHGLMQPEGLCDPLRLTLNTAFVGLCGESNQTAYFESFGIDCEFCDGENAVLLCTPFNTERDFERVRKAVEKLTAGQPVKKAADRKAFPEKAMSIRDAVFSSAEIISVHDAVGRIAADTACPCPPGVPVIMPGEIIDAETAAVLSDYGFTAIKTVKTSK